MGGDEECDGGRHCSDECLFPRVTQVCAFLVCETLPEDMTTIDIIEWLTRYCTCLAGPPPCANFTNCTQPPSPPDNTNEGDDNYYDRCTNYDDQVVCPTGLYNTQGVGYWTGILVGFVLVSVIISYAGSLL